MARHLISGPAKEPTGPVGSAPQSAAQRAARYLGGFLALMLLFTLLSRAADQLTIPRARLSQPSPGSIDRSITAFGKVEALSAQAVTAFPGLLVGGVSVKAGSMVEQGDPLFTLDSGDIEEKLDIARENLLRQDMDLSDQASRDAAGARDRDRAIERANEDYAAAQKRENQAVSSAERALEEAKAELAAASPPSGDLELLQENCARREEELTGAKEELDRLLGADSEESSQPEDGEAESSEPPVSQPTQSPLDAARERVAAAQAAKDQADRELEEYREAAAKYERLKDSAALAEEAYGRALDSRETALRSAARSIEDAQRPIAQDSSVEKAELDRDRLARQVEELEELLAAGGMVCAPFAGTVTEIMVSVGAHTPDGTAALICGQENSRVFTAQVPAENGKYLSAGDEAVLRPGGRQEELQGLKIESVSAGGEALDITVRLPENSLAVGTSAELEVRRKSINYSCLVPLSALHEENGSFFLLVVKEKTGFLGPELTAARKDVAVLEKNDSYAAIEPGALEQGQGFIDYSNKPVNAGDRIRLEAS